MVRSIYDALSLHCTTTTSDSDLLALKGKRGRALVESRYTWSAVCEKMVEGYDKAIVLRGAGKTPQAAAKVIAGIVPRNAD